MGVDVAGCSLQGPVPVPDAGDVGFGVVEARQLGSICWKDEP